MGVGDIRYTVLEVVNEVQRKLGLTESSLAGNKLAVEFVDFVNDICNDLSDYGNWQEMLVSANISCQSSVRDYLIPTSGNVKNIGDIYFTLRTGPMRHVTIEEMRTISRVGTTGTPTQYTIFGTDASSGNPIIRVNPLPVSAQVSGKFSVVYYQRAPLYTTSDAAVIIPFPGNVVVSGVLAKYLLNESGGAPTDRYTKTYQEYLEGRKEALNRFNGDSGWSVSFTPSYRGRRR